MSSGLAQVQISVEVDIGDGQAPRTGKHLAEPRSRPLNEAGKIQHEGFFSNTPAPMPKNTVRVSSNPFAVARSMSPSPSRSHATKEAGESGGVWKFFPPTQPGSTPIPV